MRYAGWYPRRRGILEHLDKGTISLLDLAVHDFLCLICDHETGVAYASSEKIHALCPVEINARAIRRSLAKMERIGWIKRFCIRGRRGNYPILIAKYFVRDTSGNWMSVNAEKTTDLANIQFDAVHDAAFLTSRADREPVPEPVPELSGIQEVRTEKPEHKKPTNLVCSLRCADGWEFINCEKMGSIGFQDILEEEFKAYKDEGQVCREHGQCSCSRSYFLELVMDRCKNKTVRYPRAILRMKKQLERLERLAS